jgi:LPXTG-motif cell wall-anchored protein
MGFFQSLEQKLRAPVNAALHLVPGGDAAIALANAAKPYVSGGKAQAPKAAPTSAATEPMTAPAQDRTLMWVGVGLLALVVLYLFARRK